jgi:hypothetical protein
LDEGDPIEVRAEEMDDLHPGGREEEDVGDAEGELGEEEGEDDAAEAGCAAQEGEDAKDGEESGGGVDPPHADEEG